MLDKHLLQFLDLKNIYFDHKNISLDSNFGMETQNMKFWVFLADMFPKNSQYLVNGESNQKKFTNKKDGELNFLYGVCYQI